jgi:hypothetical protein
MSDTLHATLAGRADLYLITPTQRAEGAREAPALMARELSACDHPRRPT